MGQVKVDGEQKRLALRPGVQEMQGTFQFLLVGQEKILDTLAGDFRLGGDTLHPRQCE